MMVNKQLTKKFMPKAAKIVKIRGEPLVLPNYSGVKYHPPTLADFDSRYVRHNLFTAGSILFSAGSTVTENNSKLFWDDVNKRLGIGTNVPGGILDAGGWTGRPSPIAAHTNILGALFMGNTGANVPRLRMDSNVNVGFIQWNRYYDGSTTKQFDVTQPSFAMYMRGNTDRIDFSRAPAGSTTLTVLLELIGNGNVRVPAQLGVGMAPSMRFSVLSTATNIANFDTTSTTYGRVRIDGSANCDAQLSFLDNGSTKWSIGNDSGTDSFMMRTGFGKFGTNDRLKLTPSGQLSINEKSGNTAIGGFAIKLTNKTGANSVAGEIVEIYDATAIDDAVSLADGDSDHSIGVFLDDGVADGSEAWVVISGIADVMFEDGIAAVRGYWVFTSSTTGRAEDAASSPGHAVAHWQEIGHCLESVGSGTDIKARCVLHFN